MSKPLRERLTATMIDDLVNRRRTDAEVAAELHVNEKYLNYVLNSVLGKSRIRGKVSEFREKEAQLVEARRQIRIREAKKVANGRKSIEKAAKAANCSERTIRRYMTKVIPEIPTESYE